MAITLLFGFAAVNTGNNLLFLVVAALLAFMVATGYVGMLNIRAVVSELVSPDDLFVGTPGRFRLLLKNEKRYIPSFLIRLTTPYGETTVPYLPAGSCAEASVEFLFSRRGWNMPGQLIVSSAFPVNFFVRQWHFQHTDQVMVYPRLLAIAGLPLGATNELAGITGCTARGHDGELERINRYSGSEPLRSIHWKHSARNRELLVKQFSAPTLPPLLIDPTTLPGADLEQRFSHAAWLIKMRPSEQPVGLILGDRRIAPAIGRKQTAVLLSELALYGHD